MSKYSGNNSKKKRKFLFKKKVCGSKSKMPKKDRCSNPFNLRLHVTTELRKPSKKLLREFPELKANQWLCSKCRKYKRTQIAFDGPSTSAYNNEENSTNSS